MQTHLTCSSQSRARAASRPGKAGNTGTQVAATLLFVRFKNVLLCSSHLCIFLKVLCVFWWRFALIKSLSLVQWKGIFLTVDRFRPHCKVRLLFYVGRKTSDENVTSVPSQGDSFCTMLSLPNSALLTRMQRRHLKSGAFSPVELRRMILGNLVLGVPISESNNVFLTYHHCYVCRTELQNRTFYYLTPSYHQESLYGAQFCSV